MIKKLHGLTIVLIGGMLITACTDHSNVSSVDNESRMIVGDFTSADMASSKSTDDHSGGIDTAVYSEFLAGVNEELAARGITDYELKKAETLGFNDGTMDFSGQTIFANDRTKRLSAQWVPGDTRRGASGNSLTYMVFEPFKIANGSIDSEPEIDASFETWNSLKKNSGPEIVKVADTGVNPSAILDFGTGVGNPFVADIVELGFLPGSLFDAVLGPGSSESVLGVAFTFVFTETNDVALKEIWYNDSFQWSTNGTPGTIDIQSVALHENGHALGFGHFGKLLITNSNGKLHVSPQAVMNAAYLAPQRTLLGTDKASFNSVYGDWPQD